MTDFYDGQISDILPHALKDDDAIQALSLAIREGTRLLYRYAQQCYVYCSIDTMPDDILDLLAVELRTQYYSDDLDIETKRSLVSNTLLWYMKAGTPEAVEELIQVVFGEGTLEEWFDYGGEPYWFRIYTDVPLGEEDLAYFSDMLRRVKNTRSHIGSIGTLRSVAGTFYSGVGGNSAYHPETIQSGCYNLGREVDQPLFSGTALFQYAKPEAIIEYALDELEPVDQLISAGAERTSYIKAAPIMETVPTEFEPANMDSGSGIGGNTAYSPAAILQDETIPEEEPPEE